MVQAGLVENSNTESLFWVNPDHRNVMVKTNPTILLSGLLNMVSGIAPKIKACFRLDGPSGTEYRDYEKLRSSNAITDNSSKQNVIKILHGIPSSLKCKLASGHASYLDIGCGLGIQTSLLSRVYPQCICLGVDIEPSAIDKARDEYPSENYPNLHFSVMDATKLPDEWTSKFDY
uniref:Methyltransferase domain-containing protein n=1 Tax=Romanomermis culicivorax TaxID=13658 RepID=A0A915KGD3_ROMCU